MDLIRAVFGPAVDIEKDAVDRDPLILRDLQRFCRRSPGPLHQIVFGTARRKVRHPVREQQDRAGQIVFRAHIAQYFRRPKNRRADIGVVARPEDLRLADQLPLVLHAVDGPHAGIVADRIVKCDDADMVSGLCQQPEEELHRVITQALRVRSDPMLIAEAAALVHDQHDIVAVGDGTVLIRTCHTGPAADQHQ